MSLKFARRFLVKPLLVLLAALVLAVTVGGLVPGQAILAQGEAETYTVQPGDTLGLIAGQFGVSVNDLAAANGIEDVNVLEVGQVLVIPGADGMLPPAPWLTIAAHPRQTLASIAADYGMDLGQLAAFNKLRESTRLFPGQPIRIPSDYAQAVGVNFGAIRVTAQPNRLAQGRTGLLRLETTRPVQVNVDWNGLTLPLIPDPTRADEAAWFVPVPVPALIALGRYDLVIEYTAANGRALTHTLPVNVFDGGYTTQNIVISDEKSGLLAPEVVQAEESMVRQIWTTVTPELRWSDLFARPIAEEFPTTSPFGTRRSYNSGPVSSYHAGQDFGAPEDVPVYAPASGTVVLAEALNVRGNAVIIDHGRGIFTGYWHLNRLDVTVGQEVTPGQLIGVVGTTGLSTGAHLHWELRIFGIAVDPMQFLEGPLLSTAPAPAG